MHGGKGGEDGAIKRNQRLEMILYRKKFFHINRNLFFFESLLKSVSVLNVSKVFCSF